MIGGLNAFEITGGAMGVTFFPSAKWAEAPGGKSARVQTSAPALSSGPTGPELPSKLSSVTSCQTAGALVGYASPTSCCVGAKIPHRVAFSLTVGWPVVMRQLPLKTVVPKRLFGKLEPLG